MTTAALITAAPNATPTQTSISLDLLMSLAIEEYDHIVAGSTHRKVKEDAGVVLFLTHNGSNCSHSGTNCG